MGKAELQRLFDRLGIRPNKRLGQCFLIDDNLAGWIVRQLDPKPDDVVIEVGPGAGALTRHLHGKVRRLILIEMDRKLAGWLRDRYPDAEVIHGDAVEFDIRPLFREEKVKLIGNLPYSAGSEIMRNFLTQPTPVSEAVVMVQREVAGRICAEPGTKAIGILSLMLQSEWRPAILKTVGSEPFSPRPEVESTILRFDARPAGALPMYGPQDFAEIVKRGFSQRRKQLRKNLRIDPPEWKSVTESLALPVTVRAEELSLEQWIDLSNRLNPVPAGQEGQSGDEIFDVVDENDVVTGQATRSEVHRENLLHRAIHIFVFNRKGDLYLQKRSRLKDKHAGRWDSSASGHLDSGEDYGEAAVRELGEELGIRTERELEPIGSLPAGESTGWEFVHLFRCRHNGRIRTHGSEIEYGGFFPVNEVKKWIEERPRISRRRLSNAFESTPNRESGIHDAFRIQVTHVFCMVEVVKNTCKDWKMRQSEEMKLTVNLDEDLLERVMAITGATTKTEAITTSLREMARRARLVEVLREGLGASSDELKDMFDSASDPMSLRVAEGGATYKVRNRPTE